MRLTDNQISVPVAGDVNHKDGDAGRSQVKVRMPLPFAAPRVLESPVNFECRLTQLIRLSDVEGAEVDSWLVLGQVMAVHIDRQWLVDGVYDTSGPRPILRAGGPSAYSVIEPGSVFHMDRPQ